MKQFLRLFWLPLAVLLLCGCSNPMRSITIKFPDLSEWDKACNTLSWHTLVWTDGNGGLEKLHLNANQRVVTVEVPWGKTIVFGAFPLGYLEPMGGVLSHIAPADTITLSQQDGHLCSLLLNLSVTAPNLVSRLNVPRMLQSIAELADDSRYLDENRLAHDIVNGSLSNSSYVLLMGLEVEPGAIPEGVWISNDQRIPSMWVDPYEDPPKLFLPGGMHRFLNRSMGLEMRIMVDAQERKAYRTIRPAPAIYMP